MRVLHLHNIAGVPTVLAKAQRKLGVDARVVVFREHKGRYGYDFNMDVDRFPRIMQPAVRLNELLTKYRDFDIYHMHSSSFLPFYADVVLLKAMKKKVVYTHWGSDIRGKGISPFSFSRLCDLRYVGMPELFKWAPKQTLWLPYPIDLERWTVPREKSPSEKVTVLHAPTVRAVKGTAYVINAVNELKKEGENVELTLVENVPNSAVYDVYSQADIVVDQLLTGFYGTFACETMAMEKPVCSYIMKDLLKYVPGCPVVNVSKDTLKDELRRLVRSKELRKKIGKQSRQFVEKTHDSMKVAKAVIEQYEKLLQ